jgi:tryptophan synthase alpha chain
MSYYNPIFAFAESETPSGEDGGGERAFIAAAQAAGVDGLILPDLPPDEGASLIAAARQADVGTVFLVAPTSTDARIELVGGASSGFVYAVSVTGVTGARSETPTDVPALVARTRAASGLPVAVGFGVSNAEQAGRLAPHTDGVVVGSAIVSIIGRMRDADDTAELETFAADLAAAMKGTAQREPA